MGFNGHTSPNGPTMTRTNRRKLMKDLGADPPQAEAAIVVGRPWPTTKSANKLIKAMLMRFKKIGVL